MASICSQHDMGSTYHSTLQFPSSLCLLPLSPFSLFLPISPIHIPAKLKTPVPPSSLPLIQQTGPDPSTNCSDPILNQFSFFGTQLISVIPSPTGFTIPTMVDGLPFTNWISLSTELPGALPSIVTNASEKTVS